MSEEIARIAAKIVAKKLRCPKCKKSQFTYYERAMTYRSLVDNEEVKEGKLKDGRLQIHADYEVAHYDTPEGEDAHLYCHVCKERRELPEGVEIDFV
jgi:hypothetical protein